MRGAKEVGSITVQQEEGRDRVDKGGARAGWVSGRSLKCPPPMTAYLVLDMQTGPCLDQQVYDVAVTIFSGRHERSGAILYREWTRGGTDRRVWGGAGQNEVERGARERGVTMCGSFNQVHHHE